MGYMLPTSKKTSNFLYLGIGGLEFAFKSDIGSQGFFILDTLSGLREYSNFHPSQPKSKVNKSRENPLN